MVAIIIYKFHSLNQSTIKIKNGEIFAIGFSILRKQFLKTALGFVWTMNDFKVFMRIWSKCFFLFALVNRPFKTHH